MTDPYSVAHEPVCAGCGVPWPCLNAAADAGSFQHPRLGVAELREPWEPSHAMTDTEAVELRRNRAALAATEAPDGELVTRLFDEVSTLEPRLDPRTEWQEGYAKGVADARTIIGRRLRDERP